jgi:hypothetical protein
MEIGWRGLASAILLVAPLCYLSSQGQAQNSSENSKQDTAYKTRSSIQMYKFKKTVTTIFWVGENATNDNGFISNRGSYWDSNWMKHYGGVDSPSNRKGYMPAAFTPRQNPFYVALPFAEADENGNLKEIARKIPGYGTKNGALTRNRWVEIRYKGKSCYAQWQDVGPFGEDDFDWVFGTASKPKNMQGLKAGLDISPAAAQYIGMKDNDKTEWRFVEEADVPDGPWKVIVTR